MRVNITVDPYAALDEGRSWIERGIWPCKWIGCKGSPKPPFVAAFRKRLRLEEQSRIRAHVSADERYELYLDSVRIGRGSERGDRANWFYKTYEIDLTPGEHVIVARVWALGSHAPYAQMSVTPGFLFATECEFIDLIGTGATEWDAKLLTGYEFTNPSPAWGAGANLVINGDRFPWGFEKGEGADWERAEVLHEGASASIRNEVAAIHLLRPARLPEMIEREFFAGSVRFVSDPPSADTSPNPVRQADNLTGELDDWNLIHGKGSITVPPGTRRRVIIDLDNYYCAYPEIVTSGGAGSTVRIRWDEALYESPDWHSKGNRDEIEGKFFRGVGDTFKPDGGPSRRFETLWWHAGRYIELYVETADQPLVIESLKLRETRYPLEMESSFAAGDARLTRIVPIMLRGLQMCCHETYMDCPFYEQLMYVGDTRLEAMTTYMVTRDDRLPRKALAMFDASRLTSGLTQSRYPSRVTQVIPPFSLWWIGMVHDFARWRDDRAFVRSLMPGVRGVVDYFLSRLNADGLVQQPEGWNFMDWVTAWPHGIPPEGETGASGVINWQFALALAMAAELEEWMGEIELAARGRRLASELGARVSAAFWDDRRSLFADDLGRKHFSEHAQCLAILSGLVGEKRRGRIARSLLVEKDLSRTTIYFTHYLFEIYRTLGLIDALFDRMGLWFDLEKMGFKTTVEMPEPSRSDCHGWGAHPIYHYFATILGIRPASMGFSSVKIEPHLGPLTAASARLVHSKGEVEVDFRLEAGRLAGSISLPEGVKGSLTWAGKTHGLNPGRQVI